MTQGGVPTTKAGTGRTIGKAALERLLVESAPETGEPASTLYLRPGEGQEFLESLGATGQDWRGPVPGGSPAIPSAGEPLFF